jgi:FMN phosphatase YigB (HAD superfamily)
VAVTAVVFDVGETLVDETRNWEHVADACGVPRFTLMALVGFAIARGESHRKVREWLEIDPPAAAFAHDELYPDAEPCLRRCKERGLFVGVVGNMGVVHEEGIPTCVDFVASSERWEVEKPSSAFFERVVAETGRPAREVAYVGDLVHNDIEPALGAGLKAVHIRRGPWGHVQEPPPEAIRIRSLDELPEALERV